MIRGRWNSSVDEKWRLLVPAGMKKLKNRLLLGQGEDGCVQIYTPFSLSAKRKNPIFLAEIKTNSLGLRRISIPLELR